jgi:single-stranded DNA-binding protein
MNKVILMGRLVRDPEVRYSQSDNAMAIARYTIAVDRRRSRNDSDENTADFIIVLPLANKVNLLKNIVIRELSYL